MSATFSPQPAIYYAREDDGTRQPANLHVPGRGMAMDPGDPSLGDAEAGPSAANTPRNSLGLGGAVARSWKNFTARVGVSGKSAGGGDDSREEYNGDDTRSAISRPRSFRPSAPPSQGQPSPYTPARSFNDLAGGSSTVTATDDALDGTTAVGHHENPYMQTPSMPFNNKAFHQPPYASPVTVEPEQASDYAKMSSTPSSSISSMGHYVYRLKQMFKQLNDLPWVADRCTVDYVPGAKELLPHEQQQQPQQVMHIRVPSWYSNDQPSGRVDLLAGGTPDIAMKQTPMYGPGLSQYASHYETSYSRPATATPGPPPPLRSTTPRSPMPVYGYYSAPPEPDMELDSPPSHHRHQPHPQTPYAPAYAVSDQGLSRGGHGGAYGVASSDQSRVYTPAGGVPTSDQSHQSRGYGAGAYGVASSEQSRVYTPAGMPLTRSDGKSYTTSSSSVTSDSPGSPTRIYEQRGVTSPGAVYPYPIFSPSQ